MEKKQILIFGGTTEGRTAAERLLAEGLPCTVCVATEYGSEVMEPHPLLTVHVGRMDRDDMAKMLDSGAYACVVDATHPHARKVTEEIRAACGRIPVPYLRVQRDVSEADLPDRTRPGDRSPEDRVEHYLNGNTLSADRISDDLPPVLYAEDAEQAASFLARTEGRILVTTGTGELEKIAGIIGDPSRIAARVLPSPQSLSACISAGLSGDRIIAMQGPFDCQMNISTIRHTRASWLLTKETGAVGGYPEKLEAARSCGIRTVVIRAGVSESPIPLEQVLEAARSYAGGSAVGRNRKSGGIEEGPPDLWLVGVGTGSREARTGEAEKALARAEVIFGAESVLRLLREDRLPYEKGTAPVYVPVYDGARILQYLQKHPQIRRAAVAYSGDSGFYSGAASMLSLLGKKEKDGEKTARPVTDDLHVCRSDGPRTCGKYEKTARPVTDDLHVHIICGTSCVSWFAARAGIPWQNWKILSSHGRTCNLVGQVRRHPECFLLLSGAEDLRGAARLLVKAQTDGALGELRLIYGYELSRPQEVICSCTPGELCGFDESRLKEGLYVLYIEHKDAEKTPVLPGISDRAFLRGKAPMTSAEVRALSLCRLGLTARAVVWDIGAGTGSVSVEAAMSCPEGTVWSVEYKKDALDLLYKNREKFCLSNMEILEGRAPEILEKLPAPTHVFIGGSGGEIGAVIEKALAKNPRARFVANCITAETLTALYEAVRRLPVCSLQAVQVSVQRLEELGRYHYLKAQNPVFIISFTGEQ